MSTPFDEADRRKLAAQATTIRERAQLVRDARFSALSGFQTACLDDWKSVFDDEDRFERRLSRLGVKEAEYSYVFDGISWPAERQLPEWVGELDSLLGAVTACSSVAPLAGSRLADRLRRGWESEHAFAPVATAASVATLERNECLAIRDISDTLLDELVKWYAEAFESRFGPLLTAEFEGNVSGRERATDSDELYREYLEYLFEGGIVDICRAYPMFGRLFVTHVQQWATHAVQLCRRCVEDRQLLAETLGSGKTLGPVSSVTRPDETCVGGRPTMVLEFESDLRAVYKDRSVEPDEYFYETLDRVARRADVPRFELPTVLSRDGYGWVEWVDSAKCSDEAAVERYYRRAGALVAVCYLLGIEDCWRDNLVASGEHPVVIDAETVFAPRPPQAPGESKLFVKATDGTILSTGLLPVPDDGGTSRVTRQSTILAGLGRSSGPAELDERVAREIDHPGTDAVTVSEQSVVVDREQNVPTVGGVDHPPMQYVNQIREGFERIYRDVLNRREDGEPALPLPDDDEWFESRVVSRTAYDSVLRRLTEPAALHSGRQFSLRLEQLAAPLLHDLGANDAHWDVFRAEYDLLQQLRTPVLSARPDGIDVSVGSDKIEGLLTESGIERCRQRIQIASEDDLASHLDCLERAVTVTPE